MVLTRTETQCKELVCTRTMALIRLFALGVILGMSSVDSVDGAYDKILEYIPDCNAVIQNCANILKNDLSTNGNECRSTKNYLNCVKRYCTVAADFPNTLNENMRTYLESRGVPCDVGAGTFESIDKKLETCRVLINSCADLFNMDYLRSGNVCGSVESYLNCVQRNCSLAWGYPDLMEQEVQTILTNEGIDCESKHDNLSLVIVVSSCVGAVLLVILIVVGCSVCRKRRKSRSSSNSDLTDKTYPHTYHNAGCPDPTLYNEEVISAASARHSFSSSKVNHRD